VFIGNLPLSISEETIWEFFGSCGQVINVRIVRDKTTNLGKGFGYVTFADKSTIELALQLAGTDCGGRPIRINKCTKEGFHKETQLFKEKKKQMIEAANTDGNSTQKQPLGVIKSFKQNTDKVTKPAFAAKNKSFDGPRKPVRIVKPTERNMPGVSIRKPIHNKFKRTTK
jgi:RNA recognition motif-containing protein